MINKQEKVLIILKEKAEKLFSYQHGVFLESFYKETKKNPGLTAERIAEKIEKQIDKDIAIKK